MQCAATCGDCRVQTRVISYGVSEAGLFARSNGGDRYEVVLLPTNRVRLRCLRAGVTTTLPACPSTTSPSHRNR